MRKHYSVHPMEVTLSTHEDANRLDARLNQWAATDGRLVQIIVQPKVLFAIFEREFIDMKGHS